jgi:hypothetical protein
MQIKDVVIPYKQSNPIFRLYCLGDIHAGTIHCLEKDIKEKVKEITQTDNAYVVGMGDYAEFITPSDKRFDPSQNSIAGWVEPDNLAECQTNWIVDLFKPIKSKCLGLLYGNHEESIRTHNHDNVAKNICGRLEVDNLGYSCFLRIYFNRENSTESHMITGALTHGASGAITPGAKRNILRRFMHSFDANFYAYAHMHDIVTDSRPYLTTQGRMNKSQIKDIESIGAVTGSWFRTYTKGIVASYGERKVYPPTTLGCIYFEINAVTGEIDAHRSK